MSERPARRWRRPVLAALALLALAAAPLTATLAADAPPPAVKPAPLTFRSVETSYGRISVMISDGHGPNVFFIHGNSAEKEVFLKQFLSPLGHKYHMVAMDLPGHGHSANAPDPAKDYNIPGYAQAALEVMDKLHLKTATVVGWSLGGHIGIDMLPRRPSLQGLLIMGTPPIAKTRDALAQGFKPNPHMGLTGKDAFTDQDVKDYSRDIIGAGPLPVFVVKGVRRTDGRARAMMLAAFAQGVGEDQRQIVETSKVPLAIVAGSNDAFVNNAYLSVPAYGNLWGGKVVVIDGAGHAPFWESPRKFNHVLAAFLADVNGRPKTAK